MTNLCKTKIFTASALIFSVILLAPNLLFSQYNINRKNFTVCVDARQLNDSLKKFLLLNNISEIKRITRPVIKPDSKGQINKQEIERIITKLYPGNSDSGICVIDWEGKEFDDLNSLAENDEHFKFLLQQFKDVIITIKSIRPNVALGIYGLPLRFNNLNPKRKNTYNTEKLYPLLKICDFLNPSCYILYADEEIGPQKNINYLKGNLDNAFQVAADLNKPVIVYMAMRYYNRSSKKYLQLIPESEFKNYSDFLVSYTGNNDNKVSGMILWNGDDIEPAIAKKEMINDRPVLSKNFITEHNNMLCSYLSLMVASKNNDSKQ